MHKCNFILDYYFRNWQTGLRLKAEHVSAMWAGHLWYQTLQEVSKSKEVKMPICHLGCSATNSNIIQQSSPRNSTLLPFQRNLFYKHQNICIEPRRNGQFRVAKKTRLLPFHIFSTLLSLQL